MIEDADLSQLLAQLDQGDSDAARAIFNTYSKRLTALARSRLPAKIRQKMEPEDVSQSVFRSFFVRQADGQFELSDWDSLWSLLVRITIRKCGRRTAMFHARKRDIRRELVPNLVDEEGVSSWRAIAREPSPAEAACLQDTLENLMAGLSQRQRDIVVLRLQGYSIEEISERIDRTQRTVLRALAQVRAKLSQDAVADTLQT